MSYVSSIIEVCSRFIAKNDEVSYLPVQKERMKQLCLQIESLNGGIGKDAIYYTSCNRVGIVTCDATTQQAAIVVENIRNELEQYLRAEEVTFAGVGSCECMQDYYEETIKPLEEYDIQNKSNLVLILDSYLKHNGSLQDMAEDLNVHKTTIQTKLQKVEKMLHVDITSFSVRSRLEVGLMVSRIRLIGDDF